MAKNTSYLKPAKKAPTAKTLELADIIAGQLVDHKYLKYGEELTPEFLEKEVTFVMASNGLFKVTKKPTALFIEELETNLQPVAGLATLEAGAKLLVPKIPQKYLIEVLSWYRAVERRDHTEASNLFFWNEKNVQLPTDYINPTTGASTGKVKGLTIDGQLIMYCPQQVNSATLSSFGDDPMVDWLRENTALFLEIHSHNVMDAFFSGTDDANENMTQFYAVWGRVLDAKPAFVMRYVVGDTRVEVPMSHVFDVPQVTGTIKDVITTVTTTQLEITGSDDSMDLIVEQSLVQDFEDAPVVKEETEVLVGDYPGPWKEIPYPEEWMEQHEKETFRYSTGTYNYGAYDYPDPYGYDTRYTGNYAQRRAEKYAQAQGGKGKGKKTEASPEGGSNGNKRWLEPGNILSFKPEFLNPEDETASNLQEIVAIFETLTADGADIEIALTLLEESEEESKDLM